jgi:hypothetical protein
MSARIYFSRAELDAVYDRVASGWEAQTEGSAEEAFWSKLLDKVEVAIQRQEGKIPVRKRKRR